MAKYVRNYESVGMADVALVGGKNASLGEMIQGLASKGVKIPDGFVQIFTVIDQRAALQTLRNFREKRRRIGAPFDRGHNDSFIGQE